MAEELVRALADFGPAAAWLGGAALGLVATFLLYIGIVLVVILRTTDPGRQRYLHQVFRDLLDLIRDICRGRAKQ